MRQNLLIHGDVMGSMKRTLITLGIIVLILTGQRIGKVKHFNEHDNT